MTTSAISPPSRMRSPAQSLRVALWLLLLVHLGFAPDSDGRRQSPANTGTVNCESPFRRGEFFHRELAVDNSGGPVWQALTNTAVFAGAGPEGADIVEERRGQIFVPQEWGQFVSLLYRD